MLWWSEAVGSITFCWDSCFYNWGEGPWYWRAIHLSSIKERERFGDLFLALTVQCREGQGDFSVLIASHFYDLMYSVSWGWCSRKHPFFGGSYRGGSAVWLIDMFTEDGWISCADSTLSLFWNLFWGCQVPFIFHKKLVWEEVTLHSFNKYNN